MHPEPFSLDASALWAVLAAVAGAAFLEGRLLLLRELVGETITLFEMPLGVRVIDYSSSSEMEIRTVAGVKMATGVGP
jgi:hypothetical protein